MPEMVDGTAKQSASALRKPRSRKWLFTIVGLLAIAAIAVLWQQRETRLDAKELLSRRAIEKTGGLIVMDANRKHPASLNLANLSPEALDQTIKESVSLRHLKIYDLTRKSVTNEHAQELAKISSLTSLHVSGTQIGDSGLKHLRSLKRLQTLLLANAQISDAGLQHLGGIRSLVVVDLSGNNLEGDLKPLQRLPKLQWLLLNDVSLTPEALTNIGSITSLRRLSVVEGSLSNEELNQLKKLNPSLSIE